MPVSISITGFRPEMIKPSGVNNRNGSSSSLQINWESGMRRRVNPFWTSKIYVCYNITLVSGKGEMKRMNIQRYLTDLLTDVGGMIMKEVVSVGGERPLVSMATLSHSFRLRLNQPEQASAAFVLLIDAVNIWVQPFSGLGALGSLCKV